MAHRTSLPKASARTSQIFDVHRILAVEKSSSSFLYLVEWAGYSTPTWEPLSNVGIRNPALWDLYLTHPELEQPKSVRVPEWYKQEHARRHARSLADPAEVAMPGAKRKRDDSSYFSEEDGGRVNEQKPETSSAAEAGLLQPTRWKRVKLTVQKSEDDKSEAETKKAPAYKLTQTKLRFAPRTAPAPATPQKLRLICTNSTTSDDTLAETMSDHGLPDQEKQQATPATSVPPTDRKAQITPTRVTSTNKRKSTDMDDDYSSDSSTQSNIIVVGKQASNGDDVGAEIEALPSETVIVEDDTSPLATEQTPQPASEQEVVLPSSDLPTEIEEETRPAKRIKITVPEEPKFNMTMTSVEEDEEVDKENLPPVQSAIKFVKKDSVHRPEVAIEDTTMSSNDSIEEATVLAMPPRVIEIASQSPLCEDSGEASEDTPALKSREGTPAITSTEELLHDATPAADTTEPVPPLVPIEAWRGDLHFYNGDDATAVQAWLDAFPDKTSRLIYNAATNSATHQTPQPCQMTLYSHILTNNSRSSILLLTTFTSPLKTAISTITEHTIYNPSSFTTHLLTVFGRGIFLSNPAINARPPHNRRTLAARRAAYTALTHLHHTQASFLPAAAHDLDALGAALFPPRGEVYGEQRGDRQYCETEAYLEVSARTVGEPALRAEEREARSWGIPRAGLPVGGRRR